MSKEERHLHILKTAKRLFEENGYDHITIADVIKASNIARGTFYLHFSSLEDLLSDLFEEVVNDTWKRIAPILEDLSISFFDCTVAVIHAVFRMFDDHESMVTVFYSGGGQNFLKIKEEAMFGRLGALLVHALERRHQAHIPNLDWTVTMLISLVGEMSYYAAMNVPPEEKVAFEQRLTSFVLAGLRKHLEDSVPFLPGDGDMGVSAP